MKNLILFISLVLSSVSYSQKHSVFGGNIEVTQIGSNQFIMSATVQIDSFHVTSMAINAFDNATDTFVKTFTISLDSSAIIPLRYQTHAFDSLFVNYLSDTFSLKNNPNGYYFVNNEFIRKNNLKYRSNIDSGGFIFTCQIPDPAISGGNSNPKFKKLNDSLYLLIGQSVTIDFTCNDLDGDSLDYSLVTPYYTTSINNNKPFGNIAWKPSFSLLNISGPGGYIYIRSTDRKIIARPSAYGCFTLAIKCEEFRNGIKIGEVYRDLIICHGSLFYSVNENSFSAQVYLFPNPSNGNFTISIEDYNHSNFNLNVIDITGKLVYNQQISSPQTSINLENFNKGIYFVQLNDGVNQTTKRIVIQ